MTITVEAFVQFYRKRTKQQQQQQRQKIECESVNEMLKKKLDKKKIQSGRLIKNGRCVHIFRCNRGASHEQKRWQINRNEMTCFGLEQYAVNVRAVFLFNFIH